MMQDLLFRRFSLIAATGFVVLTVAACEVQLDRHVEDQPPPPETSETSETKDALSPKLEACLNVTPDQVATFEHCRRVWAENRRRFFGPTKQKSAPPRKAADHGESVSPPPKDQGQPPSSSAVAPTSAKE